jgi:regulation of enolase protein 1 (concanavalin A-like superfamily)
MEADTLAGELAAGPSTDHFIDPATAEVRGNAPVRLIAVSGDFQLSAHVRAHLRATFDAGALFVHAGPDTWAKLALERSPAGEDTIVTVVTRGVSDDANCVTVPVAGEAWLRVSRVGDVYTFHHSADGKYWQLARLFTLGPGDHEAGVSSQSPTGEGLTATFGDVRLTATTLGDPRDGS